MPTYNSYIFVSPKKGVTYWVCVTIRVIATIWVIITIWVTEGFRIEGIVSSIRIRLFVYNFQKKSFSD